MSQQLRNKLYGAFIATLLVSSPAMSASNAGVVERGNEVISQADLPMMVAEVSAANTFNRNLHKEKDPNAPPAEDGYHDPENEGTHVLMAA